MRKKNISVIRARARVLIRPTSLLDRKKTKSFSFGFAFPMFSLLVFVIQQSLDKSGFGIGNAIRDVMRCFVGFCAGVVVSCAVTALLYFAFRAVKADISPRTLFAAVNLSWTVPLLVNLCGLLLNLVFHIRTSVLFGFGGSLLSLIPLYESIYTVLRAHEKADRLISLLWTGCGILTVSVCGLALLLM